MADALGARLSRKCVPTVEIAMVRHVREQYYPNSGTLGVLTSC